MLSWLCVLVVVYASLYPFEDWRNQDIAPWSFVTAPWPKYNTWFDINSNLLGYAPLGFWLCLAGMRSRFSRARAWLLALACSCLLSFSLESLQTFLPMRVPSQLDWLLNTVGGIAGAVLAVMLERRGWLYRWSQFRRDCLTHDAGGSLVLLVLWPLALLFPVTVPLGLGHVVDLWRRFLLEWLPGLETRFSSVLDWLAQPMTPALEMACVMLGLMAPALLTMALCRRLVQRISAVFAMGLLAVLATAMSATLTYGPEHAWYWLTPQSGSGLALGFCVLMLMIRWSARRLTLVLLLAQLLLLLLLNMSPASTYYELTMQTWEQDRFIRFHGLTSWLNWLWPWALLMWAAWRLRHKDLHTHRL